MCLREIIPSYIPSAARHDRSSSIVVVVAATDVITTGEVYYIIHPELRRRKMSTFSWLFTSFLSPTLTLLLRVLSLK